MPNFRELFLAHLSNSSEHNTCTIYIIPNNVVRFSEKHIHYCRRYDLIRNMFHRHPMAPAVWKPIASFVPNCINFTTTLITQLLIFVQREVDIPISLEIDAIT